MSIPTTTSLAQKVVLRQVLETIQNAIHAHNPYVQDFKQIIEMSEEKIGEGRIVISSKGQSSEHPRRYNAPTNLNEVCILMNPGKHDLVSKEGVVNYIM